MIVVGRVKCTSFPPLMTFSSASKDSLQDNRTVRPPLRRPAKSLRNWTPRFSSSDWLTSKYLPDSAVAPPASRFFVAVRDEGNKRYAIRVEIKGFHHAARGGF